MALPALSDPQLKAIAEAFDKGSITTVKRYGHPKAAVLGLMKRGILEFHSQYSSPVRYQLTPLGFELVEWLSLNQRKVLYYG